MALKTKKAVSKRIRLTKKGKLMRRILGQSHNMSKASGGARRMKRRKVNIAKTEEKKILRYMPYS